MDELSAILDRLYGARDVIGLNEIFETVVAAGAPEAVVRAVEALPEGAYRREAVLAHINQSPDVLPGDPGEDAPLMRPLEETEAVELASDDEAPTPGLDYEGPAVEDPDTVKFQEPIMTSDLQPDLPEDYFDRTDGSDISDDGRSVRTGADQPWDPEDLAVAEGRDPTPKNVERARRELADEGPSAIERNVP